MQRDWARLVERLRGENPIEVTQAARAIPATRGRRGHVSASTLVRWILKGQQGVLLDGYFGHGSTWWTSEAALVRFFAEVTRRKAKSLEEGPTPRQEEKRQERVREELRRWCNGKKKEARTISE